MILLYSILIIISFAFYILYKGILSFYLFVFLVILPVVLAIITAIQKRKVKVAFLKPHYTTTCGKKTPITIKINNNSIFPVANLEITLSYCMNHSDKTEKFKINSPALPKDSQLLTFNIASKHCGTAHIEIANVKICDMLRLFKPKLCLSEIKIHNKTLITVFPVPLLLKNEILDYSDDNLESNVYSNTQKGDDPSEIFDIREYAENDKLNRIHWKLTAKQGETMVKDYSLPITNQIMLMLNLSIPDASENSIDLYDAIISTAYSCSTYLSEKQISHNLCWYDDSEQNTINITVESIDNVSQAMYEILGTSVQPDDCAILHNLNYAQPISAHWIFITSTLSDKLMELLEGFAQTTLITVVFVNSQSIPSNHLSKSNIKVVSVNSQSLSSELSKIIL
ncbi:MAG: DUF58 domain-containing protein [Ruminococcus sp.]|nr:DUF58 domain-containing protein [Ruminococcus sp.]